MVPNERQNLRLAAIIIPRDESDGRVEVVLFHLGEKTPILERAVGLSKPRIVNCKVCVMVRSMPTAFTRTVPNKHHGRSDFRKRAHHTLCVPFAPSSVPGMHCAIQEHPQLLEGSLDEYWENSAVVPNIHDLLSPAVFAQYKVNRVVPREWNLKICQLPRESLEMTNGVPSTARVCQMSAVDRSAAGPRS